MDKSRLFLKIKKKPPAVRKLPEDRELAKNKIGEGLKFKKQDDHRS